MINLSKHIEIEKSHKLETIMENGFGLYLIFVNEKNGSAQQWLHAMPVKIFERKMEIEKPAQAAKARLRQDHLLLPALAFVK